MLFSYTSKVLFEVRNHLQHLFAIVFSSVSLHFLPLSPCILKLLVVLIEAIHVKVEEKLGLILLLFGSFVEREQKH